MGKDINGKELGPGLSQRKSDGRYMLRYKGHCEYAKSLSEARTKLADMIQKVEQNMYLNNQISLNRYFEDFQKIRLKTKAAKQSTLKSERTMFKNHIKPALGKKRICKITVLDIKNFQLTLMEKKNHKGELLQVSTVNKIMYCLEKILNAAVRDEIIVQNPAGKVRKLKDTRQLRARDTNHRALDKEEQKLFVKFARENWYFNALMLLLNSGMRQGELRALKWSDIDSEEGVIHVRKTMSYDLENKPMENSPKTRTSLRDIPLNKNLIGILQSQKEQMEAFNREKKIRVMDDYVIKSPKNLPVRDIRRLNEAIQRIVAKIELAGYSFPHISCHCLRATFATRAIDAGMSPQTLKEILGHASYNMTMDLYYHNAKSVQRQEMEKIAGEFSDTKIDTHLCPDTCANPDKRTCRELPPNVNAQEKTS